MGDRDKIVECCMESWNRGFEDGKDVYRRQWSDHVFPFLWGLFIGFVVFVLVLGCAHAPKKPPGSGTPGHKTVTIVPTRYAVEDLETVGGQAWLSEQTARSGLKPKVKP